jgi:cytochrome c oxidase subunit I+III
MFAAIPFDQQVTDSYFVVAHFHYVLFGGAVFPIFAALFYWFPKLTGRMYHERLGVVSFWIFFVGFNLTFFPMHISGLLGMPRRVWTYHDGLGWDVYNLLSTIGAFVLAAGILLVVVNLLLSRTTGAPSGPDPWGGNTLEWATTSPPPHYNFAVVPLVHSADPNWDVADRVDDWRRLEEGHYVLDSGHETPATTVLDGDVDRVLHMPSASPWPLLLAVALSIFFVMFLTEHYVMAAMSWILIGGALVGWHGKEPQDA